MRSVVLHLLRSLALSLAITIHVSGYATSDSSILESSQFWPDKVAVNVETIGVKYGNIVEPGKNWIFLRYQDGKCLVDMGHNGIHALNVEDTDILERVTKISEERTFPFQGLFTYRYTKSFYNPETLRGFQLGDMDPYDFFLLFYFDYESGSHLVEVLGEFIQGYLNELNTEMKVEVLLLPSGNVIVEKKLENYISDGLVAPTITPFLCEGTIYTLKHDHEVKGDVVLVDKFGKVIEQFFIAPLDAQDILRITKEVLSDKDLKNN